MNLILDVQLEKGLKLTEQNTAIRFNDLCVGKVLNYNKKDGLTKIKIFDSITITRIMKMKNKKPYQNFNFLNYDINNNIE